MARSRNLYRRKLQKIYKKIDSLASKGRDNELNFFKYINEVLDKGDYTALSEALYIYYNIDISQEPDIKSHRQKTWYKICEKTSSNFSKRLLGLSKRLAREYEYLEIYQLGLKVFIKVQEGLKRVDYEIGELREIESFSNDAKYHLKNKHYARLIGDRKTLIEVTFLNGLTKIIDVGEESILNEEQKLMERYEIGLRELLEDKKPNLFILLSNGITVRYLGNTPGETGDLNGVTYTAVDQAMFDAMDPATDNFTTIATTLVTDMSGKFMGSGGRSGTTVNFDQPIGSWDTSNVTNMSNIFAYSTFNQPIEYWDVSSVTSMYRMFYSTPFNQPIGNWNTTNVTNMGSMFYDTPFNHPIGNWNVSNVTNMSYMFSRSPFNQPIGNWNTTNVTNMDSMFYSTPFNQVIGNWNTSNVTTMFGMFSRSPFNQPIGNWNTTNVTNMDSMFYNTPFNHPIGNWNVSNVTNMSYMFSRSPFNQVIENWNVSNVTDMSYMFNDATIFNQDLSLWCVELIVTEPFRFDDGATSWTLPRPNWGAVCTV